MGKAYKDNDTFVVELTTGDIVKRVVDTRGTEFISMPRVLNEIAWDIINSTPSLMKMIKGIEYKWCTVEALEGRFTVTYRLQKPDRSNIPEDEPLTDEE